MVVPSLSSNTRIKNLTALIFCVFHVYLYVGAWLPALFKTALEYYDHFIYFLKNVLQTAEVTTAKRQINASVSTVCKRYGSFTPKRVNNSRSEWVLKKPKVLFTLSGGNDQTKKLAFVFVLAQCEYIFSFISIPMLSMEKKKLSS